MRIHLEPNPPPLAAEQLCRGREAATTIVHGRTQVPIARGFRSRLTLLSGTPSWSEPVVQIPEVRR